MEVEKEADNEKNSRKKKKLKVDTKRLEHFADVEQFRYLLKHPVFGSFLEMELKNLQRGYIVDFLFYLLFVVALYIYLGGRFLGRNKASIFYFSLETLVTQLADFTRLLYR